MSSWSISTTKFNKVGLVLGLRHSLRGRRQGKPAVYQYISHRMIILCVSVLLPEPTLTVSWDRRHDRGRLALMYASL